MSKIADLIDADSNNDALTNYKKIFECRLYIVGTDSISSWELQGEWDALIGWKNDFHGKPRFHNISRWEQETTICPKLISANQWCPFLHIQLVIGWKWDSGQIGLSCSHWNFHPVSLPMCLTPFFSLHVLHESCGGRFAVSSLKWLKCNRVRLPMGD